jgi:hypothetical protein
VAATAGLIALVTITLFFTVGQPFGTLNDISLLVMTLALAPIMVGFYELGGRTPIGLARVSLAGGIAGVLIYAIVQAAMIGRIVAFQYDQAATGWFSVEAIFVIVIGAWLAGANVLAGPWLPPPLRWLGTVSGIGFIVFGVGLLLGGVAHPFTYLGGVGYQFLFPLWAYLLGRALRRSGPQPSS